MPAAAIRNHELFAAACQMRDPWTPGGQFSIDLLTGGDQVRLHLDAELPVTDLVNTWKEDADNFKTLRAAYLLYPV